MPRLAAHTNRSTIWTAVVIVAVQASPVAAQLSSTRQITGYLTVGTDARNRGLSQVYDDDTATEVGIDFYFPSRAFAGAAISNVSYPTRTQSLKSREYLIKLYAGYGWERSNWNITTSLGYYRYPDTTIDYDYSDLTLVIGYRDRLFYNLSVSNDFLSSSNAAVNHEVGITWPLAWNIELSAALGEFDSRGPASSYTHHNVGVTKLLGPFSLDLRRYDTSREVVGRWGSSAADDWVLSVSYAFSLTD